MVFNSELEKRFEEEMQRLMWQEVIESPFEFEQIELSTSREAFGVRSLLFQGWSPKRIADYKEAFAFGSPLVLNLELPFNLFLCWVDCCLTITTTPSHSFFVSPEISKSRMNNPGPEKRSHCCFDLNQGTPIPRVPKANASL